jgi:hypothetical protein
MVGGLALTVVLLVGAAFMMRNFVTLTAWTHIDTSKLWSYGCHCRREVRRWNSAGVLPADRTGSNQQPHRSVPSTQRRCRVPAP